MVFREFLVADFAKGSHSKPLVVGLMDDTEIQLPTELRLNEDQVYLLFLAERDPESAPGISVVDGFHVLLGGPGGVFDEAEEKGTYVARSDSVVAIRRADVPADSPTLPVDRFLVTLDEIAAIP